MNYILRNIKYRAWRFVRRLYILAGYCPDCKNLVNFNSIGDAHCPECGNWK